MCISLCVLILTVCFLSVRRAENEKFSEEGQYRTPGERGSGLLEIVEIRGMLEVRGREERGEKK